MRKLFLLEDDLSLISGLTFAFKKQGFALDTARTLAEAEVLWSDRKYDLLVLDVSLGLLPLPHSTSVRNILQEKTET